MNANDTNTSLARDLGEAIDDLQAALARATAATDAIRMLVPRIGAVSSLFDELESVIRSGREQIGAQSVSAPTSFSRPTLVVPAKQPETTAWQAAAATEPPATPTGFDPWTADATAGTSPAPEDQQRHEDLICFRLEFESKAGPLDLRTVDDAVSEHPAVRDVALLDYDGRKATLKVWIVESATPADVQQALNERASQLFDSGGDVTIIALEDVA